MSVNLQKIENINVSNIKKDNYCGSIHSRTLQLRK